MGSVQRAKVIWTPAEKAKLIRRAVEIQQERPDLAGLPLLRAAIPVLEPSRRRKVVAVTQAPWFEVGIQEEMKRQADERRKAGPAKIDEMRNRYLEDNNRIMSEWKVENEAWRNRVASGQDRIVALLAQILDEIRTFGAHGDPIHIHQKPGKQSGRRQ